MYVEVQAAVVLVGSDGCRIVIREELEIVRLQLRAQTSAKWSRNLPTRVFNILAGRGSVPVMEVTCPRLRGLPTLGVYLEELVRLVRQPEALEDVPGLGPVGQAFLEASVEFLVQQGEAMARVHDQLASGH